MKTLGNVLIFGDSYSTLAGYIPEGYAVYYSLNREDTAFFNIFSPEDTWWGQVIKATNSNLLLNDSWSGSTVCHTGYGGYDEKQSFVGRLNKYVAQGFFEKNQVDTVFIFGCTNDFWNNSPRGVVGGNDHENQTLANVYPAVEYMLETLKKVAPNARVIGLINTEFSKDFVESLQTIYKNAGVDCITYDYIEKQNGHPNKTGMTQIADKILEFLEK